MFHSISVLKMFFIFVPVIFVMGLYLVVFTRNLIRTLLGLELMTKAVTLLVIVCGYASGRMALAQAIVITMIIIEVVVIVVAAGVVINLIKQNDSVDTRKVTELRG
jgi:NADH-quinone oxidoreductase subunit K